MSTQPAGCHGYHLPDATPPEGQRPLRILMADDSPNNRVLVQAYLKKTPHALTFAEDGKRAVEQFAASTFDLILMDLQMPVMDGLTATEAIRARERELGLPATPILAFSANARPEDISRSRAAGCDGHLTKPISKQRLLTTIEEYGRRYRERTGAAPVLAGPIHIEIPEGLEELVAEYWEERQQELPEMLRLLAASEFERLRFLGHNMKGTGASYGFPELSQIGEALEESAKAADAPGFQNGLWQLESYIGRVQLAQASR